MWTDSDLRSFLPKGWAAQGGPWSGSLSAFRESSFVIAAKDHTWNTIMKWVYQQNVIISNVCVCKIWRKHITDVTSILSKLTKMNLHLIRYFQAWSCPNSLSFLVIQSAMINYTFVFGFIYIYSVVGEGFYTKLPLKGHCCMTLWSLTYMKGKLVGRIPWLLVNWSLRSHWICTLIILLLLVADY